VAVSEKNAFILSILLTVGKSIPICKFALDIHFGKRMGG
jgi:hypothetical protein